MPKGRKDYIKDGISLATRATVEDRKKNYIEAIQLYEKSIELFTLALTNEKISETSKSNIASKSNEYSKRAEKLKGYMNTSNLNNSSENSTKIEENLLKPNIFSCKICYESHGPQFIFECGHLPFCDSCSENIFRESEPKCPICRKKITQKMRAYF